MGSQDIAIGIVVSVVLGVLLVLIIKKIADSKWFMETLHIMCSKGDIWYVKRHLDKGSDVNAKDENGVTPLHYAAEGGYNEIVELLIDKGANVNAKDFENKTPLDEAINYKHTEVANLLRKHGGKTGEELKAEAK
jgi:ankyrin repeat protein